jgi:hypothetical protein
MPAFWSLQHVFQDGRGMLEDFSNFQDCKLNAGYYMWG